jgi:nucleoside transporter
MGSVRARLSTMMFLQYFVWGSWGVSVGGYMGDTLKFSPDQITWIFSTTALGAMISPLFVGYVADRFFSTERILAVLHLIGGGLLLTAAAQTEFPMLMTIMVAYAVCFMPTLALTNSISFHNITDPGKEFPRIRVWGTLGWIAAGLVVGILLGGTEKWFFYMAGVSSLALGLYCFTLPHTPPRGADSAGGDVFGLGAISLLKAPSFAVFVVCSFLICVPLAAYYNFANQFLLETDKPVPTALQTLGQISEVFFMAAMPFCIVRLGVKNMLLIGMLAWVIRYYCFSTLDFNLVLVGLVLHGICYDFFFVASQIYVDTKAPSHLRASAQSFIAFVTLGLGMFLGAKASGEIVHWYPPRQVPATKRSQPQSEPTLKPLPAWAPSEEYKGFWKYLDLSATVRPMLFPATKTEPPPDFAKVNDANHDGRITPDEVPDTWVEQKSAEPSPDDLIYPGAPLRLAAMHLSQRTGPEGVTRAEWRVAQSYKWETIWLWPAGMALVTCLLFMIGFHDPVNVTRPDEARVEP